MIDACHSCLARAYLVGELAPRIAGMLDRPRRRASGLLALSDEDLLRVVGPGASGSAAGAIDRFDRETAKCDLDRRGVHAICRHAAHYPSRLGELTDAPSVLFAVGSTEAFDALTAEPLVAIVGARRATGYGREVARGLGRALSVAGVPVISGLALGIDAEVHHGALEGTAPPIAVLASGPDVAYPRTHQALHRAVAQRGLVLSEMPPGQRPLKWAFPARNRIMAGLAAMTVVVEAAERSGSLITTDFAGDLDRPVGAVPGPITSAVSAGSNALLRDGAVAVTSAEDVLDELFGVGRGPGGGERARPGAQLQLDAGEGRLLSAVEAGLGVGEIAVSIGLPARETRAGLARLEARGLVRRDGLGSYRRTLEPS